MTCPSTCTASRRVVEVHHYDDLMGGRRIAKARLLCTAGHSEWIRLDLGPIENARPITRYRHEAAVRDEEEALSPRACAGCHAPIPHPVVNQLFCSARCRRAHLRAGGERINTRRDGPWAAAFAARWNAGDSTASIAAALHVGARSVSTYAAVLRRRGVALVARPHGGAR